MDVAKIKEELRMELTEFETASFHFTKKGKETEMHDKRDGSVVIVDATINEVWLIIKKKLK